jgi:hypothetical protein
MDEGTAAPPSDVGSVVGFAGPESFPIRRSRIFTIAN